MKAVVAAFNQEKALVGAFSVITNLCVDLHFKLYCSSCWLVRLQAGTRWDLPLHQPQPGQWFIHNFQEDQNKSFIPPWQWWWRVQALVAASIVLGWAAVPALQWHTPQSCRGDRGVHSGLLARAT